MDAKTLSTIIGHVSTSTTLNIYTHVTDEMRRTAAVKIDLVKAIRQRVPGIHLRTTLMVGFPGETDEDFNELVEFVRLARFERMGAFAYSEEEGTYSAQHYADDVAPEVKERRPS